MRAGANFYIKLGAQVRAGANLGALRAGTKFGSQCIFVFFFELSEISCYFKPDLIRKNQVVHPNNRIINQQHKGG